MLIKKDPITGRKYLFVTKEENINLHTLLTLETDNLVIASFDGHARILTKHGKLVIFENTPATELIQAINEEKANKVNFYLGNGHAIIDIDCQNCNDGNKHYQIYDFNGKLFKSNTRPSIGAIETRNALTFYLNDAQAEIIFNKLEELYHLSSIGEYEFVHTIHNCVSLLTDISNQTNIIEHFSKYYTDTELLKGIGDDTAAYAFIQRSYQIADYLEPNRNTITEFMKKAYGKDFGSKWIAHTTIIGDQVIHSKGLGNEDVDFEKAKNFPEILKIIETVKADRQEILPELIKIAFHNNSKFNWVTEDEINKILNYNLNQNITYHELYYNYVLRHEIAIANQHKDQPYFEHLENFFDTYSYFRNLCISDDATKKKEIEPEFIELCEKWKALIPTYNQETEESISFNNYMIVDSDSNITYNGSIALTNFNCELMHV
jgi:hypothetical protein